MGRSATAKLVFGIDLGPDDDHGTPLPWSTDFDDDPGIDFDEYFAMKLGIETVEYSDEPEAKSRFVAYCDAKRKAIDGAGVDEVSYGYEYGSTILGVTESVVRGGDWSASAIDPAMFSVRPEWEAMIKSAVETLGITDEHTTNGLTPRWYMVPCYG